MADLHFLANPARFRRFSQRVLPGLTLATVLGFAVGLYLALLQSPPDYQQGDTVRIMFVHVPSAWLSMAGYALLAGLGASLLVWRHPLAALMARAAAPVGACFALVCLATGSLWGRPMWGTYWVWDARLTSVLVLFLIYCGILSLWRTIEEPNQAARAVAILTLVGAVNVPIVKFSVDWWNTLHQPASVLRAGGPAIDPSMLYPLLAMAAAFTVLGLALHVAGMRTEILRRRVRTATILEAERLDAAA
ncbi:MAG TPA: heme ABC transporter permease [Beijerinckiaceae bacterium]|nr:heme ABC transporter permease [Beijerinckiaceae bacterium]